MRMRDVSRGRSASRSLTGLALGIAAVSALLVGHAGPAAAQTGFIPYFGKNNIHYDTFEWQVYQTDHFEIYYYPELEKHLERIAGYAESAYQKVSADLHHDLSSKVPMILFKTHSEFEQQNVIPGAAQEGVGAFVESVPRPDAPADRRSARSAVRPDRARADALLRERHHPAGADPPRRSAVGDGGVVGLRARRLGPRGPDDGAGRGRLRHRPGDERARRVRARWKPEARLQPRARGLRIHRGTVRQRGDSPVSVRAQEERHRRRRGRVRRSVQDAAGRIRSGLRALPQGAVQAVPRSGTAGSTTAAIWRRTPRGRRTSKRWPLRHRPPAI